MAELNLDEIRAHLHTDNTAMLRDMCQSLLTELTWCRLNRDRARNRSIEIAEQMQADRDEILDRIIRDDAPTPDECAAVSETLLVNARHNGQIIAAAARNSVRAVR